MEIMPTMYANAICPQIPKMTPSKQFFYQMTGGKKYQLNEMEYQILTDPNDGQMFIFYQYILYIIYSRKFPCTPYHFKYVTTMLNQIESKAKKMQEHQKTKKLVKKQK